MCLSPDSVRWGVEQISNELKDHYHVEGLDDIRVIRDRQTSKYRVFSAVKLTPSEISRRLGFLRFHSVADSRAFVERNFPSVYFLGPNATGDDGGTKVRIAFSREREDRARTRAEGDWNCPVVGSAPG